jgi:predicted lysophospholipase L1 biosynthesis ABC-type transport system permease subunit
MEIEVVGLLRDAWVLRGPEPGAELFVPFERTPFGRFRVVIESRRNRPVSEREVMAAVLAVDPTVPLQSFTSMRDLIAWTTTVPRFQAALLGVLSTIALLLAATGCFAVLSRMVALRAPEMGIRMALGASSPAIARLVLGRIALLAAWGIAAGTLVALVATRVLQSEIYGVTSSDPASYFAASTVLAVTVLLAGARPLWRAIRVDPLQSLRRD